MSAKATAVLGVTGVGRVGGVHGNSAAGAGSATRGAGTTSSSAGDPWRGPRAPPGPVSQIVSLSSTETSREGTKLAVTRSGKPSPLKSPTARARGAASTAKLRGSWKVPSPLLRKTPTALAD